MTPAKKTASRVRKAYAERRNDLKKALAALDADEARRQKKNDERLTFMIGRAVRKLAEGNALLRGEVLDQLRQDVSLPNDQKIIEAWANRSIV